MACGIVPSTTIETGEYSGRSTTVATPITFGVGMKKGEVVGANLVPYWNGNPQQAQVNVLATHADGSVRHALVSFLAPAVTANTIKDVQIYAGAPSIPQTFTANVTGDDLQSVLTIVDSTRGTYTATLTQSQADTFITDATSGGTNANKVVAGKILCEYELWIPLVDSANVAHPLLQTLCRVRIYSQWRGARVEFSVEHSKFPASGAVTWTCGTNAPDVACASVKLVVGKSVPTQQYFFDGYSSSDQPVAGSGFTHWYAARYRVTGWTRDTTGVGNGGEPPRMYTIQDAAYLAAAYFIPNFDPANPISTSDITTAFNWSAFYFSKDPTGSNSVPEPDLVANPNGVPFCCAPAYINEGGTGDRPDIGAVKMWDVYVINSRGATNRGLAWKWMLAGDANAPGKYGFGSGPDAVHMRDPVVNCPGPLFCRSGWSKFVFGCTTANHATSLGFQHLPAYGYISYLYTGERYFAEELAFWTQYGINSNSGNGRTGPGAPRYHGGNDPLFRDTAWNMRNITYAAFILPDGYYTGSYVCSGQTFASLKDVFKTAAVNQILNSYIPNINEAARPLHTDSLGGSTGGSGRNDYPCGTVYSGWATMWSTWAAYDCWRKLEIQEAYNAFDFFCQMAVYAYSPPGNGFHDRQGYPGYSGPNGTKYGVIQWTFNAPDGVTFIDWAGNQSDGQAIRRHIMDYSAPLAIFGATLSGGCFTPSTKTALSNLGEYYWYAVVCNDLDFSHSNFCTAGNPCSGVKGYPTPSVDSGGDGFFPAAAIDWRACNGWHNNSPYLSNETWDGMRWLAPVMVTAGIPGGSDVYNFCQPYFDSQRKQNPQKWPKGTLPVP